MKKFCKKPARIARVARNSINRKGYKKPARIARVANINSKAVLCVKKLPELPELPAKSQILPILAKNRMLPIYIPLVILCA